ncbi:iron ABC transporter substrate-binding protein [Parazoarcus communis]|uniref:Iron ABC transporter substrate-binding protein n=1 Tax=Parazoarcus communis TaxID=41977 RepID=A0A2U8H2E2_9RHOO|nr:iron ABC transporter substrate-binding protein [Parazoarcus communis]
MKVDRKVDGRLSCRKKYFVQSFAHENRRKLVIRLPPALTRLLLLACALFGAAQTTLAATTSDIEAAARREGVVVIYAATDISVARPLIEDFGKLYPDVRVDYRDMSSTDLYRQFVSEARTGGGADLVWSSAMDLQVKLVNDGYAQVYHSDETAALPKWAVWKDEAFGTSLEPVAMVYNRELMHADDVPRSHAELLRLLARAPAQLRGKLITYDPARSGLGFLLHSQDVLANPVVFWRLAEAFGRLGVQTEPSTADMLDRIAAGQATLGYNLLGSYAQLRAEQDPRLGVVLPSDYTLVMSRVAFISRQAKHPNAARLWLDYLLSMRGQRLLSRSPGFYSVRTDVPADEAADNLNRELGSAFRPIRIGAGLLTYLDQLKGRDFLIQWRDTIAPQP